MDRRIFTLSLAGFGAGACSPIAVLNAVAPSGGYRETVGVAYGEGARRKLDVYVPTQGQGPYPVVIFVYGGSWVSGSRTDYAFVGESLTRLGYAVVLPDYRVDPEGRWPGFIEDTAAATAWASGNIAAHGGDPSRMFLMGHSAGAYNAMMVACDTRFLAPHGLTQSAIRGVVGLAGPYDFLPLESNFMRRIFGHVSPLESTQPTRVATTATPPALLLHGDKDGTVYPRNTTVMADRLRALGVRAEAKLYPGVGHAEIVVGMSALSRDNPPVLTDFDRFARSVLSSA